MSWWSELKEEAGKVFFGNPPPGAAKGGRGSAPTGGGKRGARTPLAEGDGLLFGGVRLSWEAATQHFLFLGSIGSGKTVQLRLLLHSVVKRLLREPRWRLVLFDEKQEFIPLILGMGVPEDRMIITNPTDRRAKEWEMSADCREPDVAFQIATILIPEENNSQNRYFSDAAREFIYGVLRVFAETATAPWTLYDVLQAVSSPKRLAFVLAHTEEGREIAANHLFESTVTTANIISTLRTKIAPFLPLAAAWKRAGETNGRFSLEDFVQGNQVMVLGNNQQARVPLQALNRVLFQRLSELLLDAEETTQEEPGAPTNRTFIVIDELAKLGKIEGLSDLATNGRSKGASLTMTTQSLPAMQHVYGKELMEAILGQCYSVLVLKLLDSQSRQWASAFFDSVERFTSSYTSTSGKESSSSVQRALREQKTVLPIEFLNLPAIRPGGVFKAYAYTEFTQSGPKGALTLSRSADDFYAALTKPAEGAPGRVPTPPEWKTNTPWTDKDLARLGLTLSEEEAMTLLGRGEDEGEGQTPLWVTALGAILTDAIRAGRGDDAAAEQMEAASDTLLGGRKRGKRAQHNRADTEARMEMDELLQGISLE